jgi:hypothetical protein
MKVVNAERLRKDRDRKRVQLQDPTFRAKCAARTAEARKNEHIRARDNARRAVSIKLERKDLKKRAARTVAGSNRHQKKEADSVTEAIQSAVETLRLRLGKPFNPDKNECIESMRACDELWREHKCRIGDIIISGGIYVAVAAIKSRWIPISVRGCDMLRDIATFYNNNFLISGNRHTFSASTALLRDLGAFEAVISKLRTTPPQLDIIRSALGAIKELISVPKHLQTSNMRIFMKDSIVPDVLSIMRMYPSDTKVSKYGCEMIDTFCYDGDYYFKSMKYMFIGWTFVGDMVSFHKNDMPGACEVVLDILRDHADLADVALRAVYSLIFRKRADSDGDRRCWASYKRFKLLEIAPILQRIKGELFGPEAQVADKNEEDKIKGSARPIRDVFTELYDMFCL